VGFFKEMKQASRLLASAPGLVSNALQGQAQSADLQVDQQTAIRQAATAERERVFTSALMASAQNVTPQMLEPLGGMAFDDYVGVCRRGAGHAMDDPGVLALASQHGIDAATWQAAYSGWNERITREPSLASHFVIRYAQGNP